MKLFVYFHQRILFGWIAAIGVLPIVLLGYGFVIERTASQQDADVNLSGSLRYRSLWLYGVTQTQANAEWHSELMEMQTVRDDLSMRYPQAVAQTEAAWHPFFDALQTKGRVDWQTANMMRDAANTLTFDIEDQTHQRHQSSQHLFVFGIGAMLFSSCLGFYLIQTRNRQQESQRAAEERFRVLFEHSSDAHLLFDETGIVDCNNAAIQMLRCQNKAEVLALHPAVLSPEYQPDGRLSLEKCVEMDATAHRLGYHRFEWIHRKTDGTDFPVEVTLTPVKVAGKATLLVVWHDLTERKLAEDKLRQSERRLREMVENLPAGAIFVAGETMFLNRAVEELTGYKREELLTLTVWFEKIYQERAVEVQAFYEGHKAANFPESPVVPIIRKDGSMRQVEFAAYSDQSGEIWILHDMTERLLAEQALKESQQALNAAQKLAHIGSWELPLQTGIGIWTEEMFRLHGLPQQPQPPAFEEYLQFVHPDDRDKVARHASAQSDIDLEYRLVLPNGVIRFVHAVVEVFQDADDVPIRMRGTLHDVTEQKISQQQIEAANKWLEEANYELEKANVKLRALATTDGLTGIANHRAFQESLAEEWQRSSRYHRLFSIILLDVDKFKLFNDSFGHPEGDRVLKIVAQSLSEMARETDIVARYGGEEFVILLSETDEQGACEAAERFRSAIEQQEWTLHPITASFGVSTLTLTTASAQALIDAADKALYQSKQTGRNRITHSAAVSALSEPLAA